MKKKSFPLAKVYQLLEPGPVLLLTTHYKNESNVMTLSWQTMVEFQPPLVACVVSDQNYSFKMLKKSQECVLNIPTKDLAKKVVQVGNSSKASGTDKFSQFQITTRSGRVVKAPLIDQCYANLECKVVNSKMAKKYNLFILEVKKAWVTPFKKYPATLHHLGYGTFMVAGKTIKIHSKMK